MARGRLRRRARFLRRARELAYRDLGGLAFSLHRFGQRNDALVSAKLSTLGHIDDELRALESSLQERQPATVLREAGITACPRCAAIHGSEDRFCPNCGLPLSRHVDLPIAGPASGGPGGNSGDAGEGADKPRTWAPPGTAPPGSTPARYATGPQTAPSASAAPTRQAPAPTPPAASGPGAASAGDAAPASPPAAAPGAGASGSAPPSESASASPAAPSRTPEQPQRAAPGATSPASPAQADDEEPTKVVRPRPGSA